MTRKYKEARHAVQSDFPIFIHKQYFLKQENKRTIYPFQIKNNQLTTTIMYYATILAATAATLAAASPLKRDGTPSFAVSDFFYDSSSTGTFFFSGEGNANGSTSTGFPFPGVTCSGPSTQTDYSKCTGPTENARLWAYVNSTATPAELLIKYEVVDTDTQASYAYYGHADVVPTVNDKSAPTEYTVVVSQQTAVI